MAFARPRKSKHKFRIGRSKAGLGLFAQEPILRGSFVIEYFGSFLSDAQADDSGGKYLFEISKKWIIQGNSRENVARYMNHSCKPNCRAEIDGRRIYIYARRKIEPREELTYNYGKGYFESEIKPKGCVCAYCKLYNSTMRILAKISSYTFISKLGWAATV